MNEYVVNLYSSRFFHFFVTRVSAWININLEMSGTCLSRFEFGIVSSVRQVGEHRRFAPENPVPVKIAGRDRRFSSRIRLGIPRSTDAHDPDRRTP